MRILGLTADYIRHDSSACLVQDGRLAYACSEERFSRLKNDPRAPVRTVQDILERFDLTLDQVDAVAVGMPPFALGRGLLDAGFPLLARSLAPVVLRHPRAFASYVFERWADGRAKRFGFEWLPRDKVRYVSHYLAHGAGAYRTGGLDPALCVTMDAAGADEAGTPLSGSVFLCEGGRMRLLEPIPRYASMGCFYNAVTQAVGFRPVGEDWKLMGLSAYGDPAVCAAQVLPLAPRYRDGAWRPTRASIEAKLIDRPRFLKETRLWQALAELVDRHGDAHVAAAAQQVFEQAMLEYFDDLLRRTGMHKVVLAGGSFHNIKFCMRLRERHPGLELFVYPAAGDVGTAVGAALQLHHELTGEPTLERLDSAALGPEYGDLACLAALTEFSSLVSWERPADLPAAVARELADGQVVGLFAGRSEWGPRALGQRSVLADPRDPAVRVRLNSSLKSRDWFMPFAPSVLEEDGPRYLEDYCYSPHMAIAFRGTAEGVRDLASAMHTDQTCRPQIVRASVSPHYHAVISAFRALTGVGAVLNTSFNRHGLPMVNHPREAVEHLVWGCVDRLAVGPFLARRSGEPVPYRQRLSLTTDELIGKWDPFDQRLLDIRARRDARAPKAGEAAGRGR